MTITTNEWFKKLFRLGEKPGVETAEIGLPALHSYWMEREKFPLTRDMFLFKQGVAGASGSTSHTVAAPADVTPAALSADVSAAEGTAAVATDSAHAGRTVFSTASAALYRPG
ncbi:hypothetical protein FN846DRAFT_888483 [Sphaerosporella brunnea]|uniref:Uncharacterized protein n=1 Tax=Sphaerosporella brunnea TaxID=1250544 RepID=A0A5J5F3R6_9PEZI|nr:hypothetical protein FN846DRAFT_888483 [Sphaerosporella brunnea]